MSIFIELEFKYFLRGDVNSKCTNHVVISLKLLLYLLMETATAVQRLNIMRKKERKKRSDPFQYGRSCWNVNKFGHWSLCWSWNRNGCRHAWICPQPDNKSSLASNPSAPLYYTKDMSFTCVPPKKTNKLNYVCIFSDRSVLYTIHYEIDRLNIFQGEHESAASVIRIPTFTKQVCESLPFPYGESMCVPVYVM